MARALALVFAGKMKLVNKAKLILLVIILAVAGMVAYLLRGSFSPKAALLVTSNLEGQAVYLDEQEVGSVPLNISDLPGGEFTLTFGAFSQRVHLTGGALTVVNWDFGPVESFSAGEVVWLSPSSAGAELLVIAKPAAEVFLDGQSLGNSPLSKEIQPGEYSLEIRKEGYFPRTVAIAAKDGYRLNVSANLSLDPFPPEESELNAGGQRIKVMDLSTNVTQLLADFSAWVRGAAFYAKEDDDRSYDYFLTAEGKLYDSDGSEVSLSSLVQQEEAVVVGYLGEQGEGISSSALTVLDQMRAALFPPPPQVLILETGVGFLRVRSGPGTVHSEIGRATPGEQYDYLGEEAGWFKIDFHGSEGWVSGQYSQKL